MEEKILPSLFCINMLQYYVLIQSDELYRRNQTDLTFLYRFITKDPAIYDFIKNEINEYITAQLR